MKQYLLAVHMIEGEPVPSEADIQASYQATDVFNRELMASGQWVFGGGLLPPDISTVVRAQGGKVVTTDGPFAESKEHIGGYYLVDVKNLDRALELAAKIPDARTGGVEVRPIVDMEMPG
jgi:hypothetical protein